VRLRRASGSEGRAAKKGERLRRASGYEGRAAKRGGRLRKATVNGNGGKRGHGMGAQATLWTWGQEVGWARVGMDSETETRWHGHNRRVESVTPASGLRRARAPPTMPTRLAPAPCAFQLLLPSSLAFQLLLPSSLAFQLLLPLSLWPSDSFCTPSWPSDSFCPSLSLEVSRRL